MSEPRRFKFLTAEWLGELADRCMQVDPDTMRVEEVEKRARCAAALLEVLRLTRGTVPIPYPYVAMAAGDYDPFKGKKP